MFKKVIPGQASRLTIVDHEETYGRHVLERIVGNIDIETCVDLGCGTGSDLRTVQAQKPSAKLYGIDFGNWNLDLLSRHQISPLSLDIEKDVFPFKDNGVDFFIANQVLEHTKEIFWVNHEVFRCLKPGGHLFLGVPNILSLHNRVLSLLGYHPTQHKLLSAHVRVFSLKDLASFYKNIGAHFCDVKCSAGSQFYPFPKNTARILSSVLPGLSFSIFMLIQKTGEYADEFIKWPGYATLESNFYTGQK